MKDARGIPLIYYILINSTKHYTYNHNAPNRVGSIKVDYDHPLMLQNKLAIFTVNHKIKDEVMLYEMEGDFSGAQIASLVQDPWQIFLPVALTKL